MKTPDEIWEALGELPDEDVLSVITKLYFRYEEEFRKNPLEPEAVNFFRRLGMALEQTRQCNVNRR